MLLEGKIAIITGSAKGIGAASAILFAREGASVIINFRKSKKDAQSIVTTIQKNRGKAIAIQADVTKPKDVERLIQKTMDRFGRIDILVNNVSEYSNPHEFLETSWNNYLTEFDGCIKSTFLCCQVVIPIMQKQKYGRIINIASTLITRPATGYSAHITSKSALLGMTRSLAKELGNYNITLNLISPGMTLTKTNLKVKESIRKSIASKTPLTRLATPEDIANAILFFASDLSSFITGTYLPVDGGLSLY